MKKYFLYWRNCFKAIWKIPAFYFFLLIPLFSNISWRGKIAVIAELTIAFVSVFSLLMLLEERRNLKDKERKEK